jgi:hypothetical protein
MTSTKALTTGGRLNTMTGPYNFSAPCEGVTEQKFHTPVIEGENEEDRGNHQTIQAG